MTPDPATAVERTTDRDLVVTRIVAGPARRVFAAWSDPALFVRWWLPASFGITLVSFDADIRTGGAYRFVVRPPASDRTLTFHGRYLEVTSPSRLVWTNDEAGDGGPVTTVTFEDVEGGTRIVVHERYPTAAALDEALASGSTAGWPEQFAQLATLLAA